MSERRGAAGGATTGAARPPESRDVVAGVLARLDRDELADLITEVVGQRIPILARFPGDVTSGPLRTALLASIDTTFAVMTDARDLSPEEGRSLAAAYRDPIGIWGVRVEDVVSSVGLNAPVVWDQIVRVAYAHELPALLRASSSMMTMISLLLEIAKVAGDTDPGVVAEERAAADELRRTLAEPADDATAALRRFVLVLPGATPREHLTAARGLRARGVRAVTGSDHVRGAVAETQADLLTGGTAVMAVGPDGDAEASWSELRATCAVAVTVGAGPVVTDDALLVERLAATTPELAALAARRLRALTGPAASGTGRGLAATAHELVRSGFDRTAVAASLGIHANTLRGRLDRFGELTGLDLRVPRDLTTLALATAATALAEEPDGDAGDEAVAVGIDYPSEIVRRVVERLDRDALAAAIAASYRRTFASFGALPMQDGDALLLPGVREGVDEAFALLADAGPVAELDWSRPGQRIAEHLRLGVTPEDTINGLAMSGQMLWRALLGVATPAELAVFTAVAGRLFRYVGGVSRAAQAEAEPGDHDAVAAHNDALLLALTTPGASRPRIAGAAAAFDLALDDRVLALVAAPTGRATAEGLLRRWRARGWIAAHRGGRVLAVAPGRARDAVGEEPGWVVAVGEPARIDGAGGQFPVLERAATLAVAAGGVPVVSPAELLIELMLQDAPALAARFEQLVVAPLAGHRRGSELLTTLDAYLDHGLDRRRTADALALHPNSLDARLRLFTQLTGLEATVGPDLPTVVLGLAARRLRAGG